MAAKRKTTAKKQGVSRGDVLWMRSGGVLLLVAVIAVAAYWIHEKIQDPSLMPVKSVVLDGSFEHVKRSELESIISSAMSGGFFLLDVSRIQSALKQLQWVSAVTVRRVWPDVLVIKIEEHVPFARWGTTQLISQRGELFAPQLEESFPDLPQIDAEAQFAADVMQRFSRISGLLHGEAVVARLRRNARSGWTLWLASGVRIELGNSRVMERLARASLLLNHFAGRTAMLDVIDARYSGGVAVSMRQQGLETNKTTIEKSNEKSNELKKESIESQV
jgi:cell division protein FtsQ